MKIAEFRQQYPEYDDLSDQEVAERLHTSLYSDVPKIRVYEELGVPVDYKAVESASNIAESGGQYIKDTVEGLASLSPWSQEDGFRKPPVIDSLATLTSGIAQNVTGLQDEAQTAGVPTPSADLADAMGQHYSDRYGGIDNIKLTAMDDPVGLLADLALPLTGGFTGAATVAKTAKMSKLAKILKAASKTSEALDPVGAIQKLSKPVYNYAIKRPLHHVLDDAGDVNRIAKKAYDIEIPINEKGRKKLVRVIKEEMGQRDDILRGIPGEFSVGNNMRPGREFIRDLLDPDTKTRGGNTVAKAQRKLSKVLNEELGDALAKGSTRDAMGLNKIKTRQMAEANRLKGYTPEANKSVEALVHKNLGTQLKERLEMLAGDKGDELARLNSNYGDHSALGRALDKQLGKQTSQFGIDYSVRSASGAMGLGPRESVALGTLSGGFGGPTAASLGLLLKNKPYKQALISALRQEGRTQQEAEKILEELQ